MNFEDSFLPVNVVLVKAAAIFKQIRFIFLGGVRL